MDAELNRVILDPDDYALYKLLHTLGKVELFCLIELLKHLKYNGEASGYCAIPLEEDGRLHCQFDWLDKKTVLIRGAWIVRPERSWPTILHDHVKKAQVVAALIAALIAIGTFMSKDVASHLLASPPATHIDESASEKKEDVADPMLGRATHTDKSESGRRDK
jgi:hypothetical protein